MFAVDRILLIGSILLLLGIASSKFSARVGLPVLVLFLAIGMLAGDQAIGGIAFENYTLAHGIGTVALALILFDGGLRTSMASIRAAAGPAIVMATAGVLVTALVTGLAASYFLGLSVLEGMLLGSIVGSTDAAAVFLVLRSKGVNLRPRLAATLEVESASNDPMAIFLTIGIIQILLGEVEPGFELIRLFIVQMGVGAVVGLLLGKATVWTINRVNLDAAGLYPVLTAAAGLLCFGVAAALGGSGFLAIYLAGIVIGNHRIVFQRGILLFHDGAAWLSQIVMFVLLGLLSFPRRLLDIAPEALLISAVLIFVARPVASALFLAPFRFTMRELVLLAWVGLKGAVPIVLATFPLIFGVPNATTFFDVTFFVVLVSATLQGWGLPPIATALGLQVPLEPEPPVMLEITSLRDVDADIVEYGVTPDSRAAGRRLRELALPDGVVVAMVSRAQHIIPPRGSTRIEPGDHVFVVLQPGARALVDRIFAPSADALRLEAEPVEFALRGETTVGDLEEFYGIRLDAPRDQTLDALLRERLRGAIGEDRGIETNGITLYARDVLDGRIERVGLRLRAGDGPEAS